MFSPRVIVDRPTSVVEVLDTLTVQTLAPEAPVEGLDEGVVHGLSRTNEIQADPAKVTGCSQRPEAGRSVSALETLG
jgi:hypothetical protein